MRLFYIFSETDQSIKYEKEQRIRDFKWPNISELDYKKAKWNQWDDNYLKIRK